VGIYVHQISSNTITQRSNRSQWAWCVDHGRSPGEVTQAICMQDTVEEKIFKRNADLRDDLSHV